MGKKNTYEQEAKKKNLLSGITTDLETKGDLKNSTIETAKDVVVGVVGGGLVGAALGRISLAIGAAVTGIGHYTKSRLATIFGVGMMASGSFLKPDQSVAGKEDGDFLSGAKDRLSTLKDSFSHRLYLDKVLDSKGIEKTEKTEENSQGEVQYFVYPDSAKKELGEGANQELDLTNLERIEKQVAESANRYTKKQEEKKSEEKKQEVSGELNAGENEFGETQEFGETKESGEIDPNDKNY